MPPKQKRNNYNELGLKNEQNSSCAFIALMQVIDQMYAAPLLYVR